MLIRPRRSVLYMPGSNARALEKAKTLAADVLIFDLEDAVAPDTKADARAQVAQAVKQGGYGHREILVRINGLDTPWWIDDVGAAARVKPHGILVPKVSHPDHVMSIADRLGDIAADHAIQVWAMIETPAAVLNAPAIAAVSRDSETRFAGFVMGTNDLAKETRARFVPGRAPMTPWLVNTILAARTYHLDIIDGVYNTLDDIEGFSRECAEARDLGFDGKTLIHPNQIDPCNAAFSPGPAEVEQAKTIITAFDRPENRGKGALQINGRMVERLHADMARRTIAIAEAIAARG